LSGFEKPDRQLQMRQVSCLLSLSTGGKPKEANTGGLVASRLA
jgi:hypothetical protein